jgi:hypothetical protein
VNVARLNPAQYTVDRCPTGYDTCVCSTSFGRAVVPEVKYSSSVSDARVGASGTKSASAPAASANGSQPAGGSPAAIRV